MKAASKALAVESWTWALRIMTYYLLLAMLGFTVIMPLYEAYSLRDQFISSPRLIWNLVAQNFMFFALLTEALLIFLQDRSIARASLWRIFFFKPTRETDLWFWMYFTAVYFFLPMSIAKSPYLSSIFPIVDLTAFGGEFVAFIFLSFTAYGIHWLSHRIPALWELHKIHHSATELTGITGPREHLLFEMIHIGIFILFFDTASMLVSFAFASRAFLNVVQHSQLNSKFGWLGMWIISPHTHRIHHLKNPKCFNKNFGSDITLWDRLFGTFQYEVPLSALEMEQDFGLSPEESPGGEKFVLHELFSTTLESLRLMLNKRA